jgi:ferric-dicitrate binding protein FerR (iron transport regulator)
MQVSSKQYKTDIQPGGNKALLTLADGSTIILDSAQNGALSTQGNIRIIKLDDGQLTYNRSGARSSSKVLYNTISTPNGGQYQLTLADGSQVWLNAASSIRFPASFTGKERRVEITGEAYFEVAKDPSMPFIVSVDDVEVQVLGTHFNVMAYKDEPKLETTLLEGSVKFVKDNNSAMLKPGQQLQLTQKEQFKVVSGIDLTKVVAWKNGLFDFNGSDFETIARKLSRWYNVEVVYNKKIDDLFYAEIPRNTKLSDVLKALELTGKINFEIEGSKIIVLP